MMTCSFSPFITLALMFIVYVGYRMYKEWKRAEHFLSDENASAIFERNSKHNDKNDTDVVNHFLTVLNELGCPYTQSDEGGDYRFRYQGFTFTIQATETTHFFLCMLPFWYEAAWDDVDSFADICKMANILNKNNYIVSTFYHKYDDVEKVCVHCATRSVLPPSFPDASVYIENILQTMINVRNEGLRMIENWKSERERN